MLERNSKIKEAPERFQDEKEQIFDIIFAYEERVFEHVVNRKASNVSAPKNDVRHVDFAEVGSQTFEPCHVINLDVIYLIS